MALASLLVLGVIGVIGVIGGPATGSTAPLAATGVKHCTLPAAGKAFQTATPAEEHLDAAKVRSAVNTLSLRLRLSVQVFRHNCLVSTDPLEPLTDQVHNNVWSVTKSVVSILTGIAIGDGKLTMSDRIGKYLPNGAGWGDAAHRAITVRQLLTQTSGRAESILAEAGTLGADPSLPREALAQPIVHKPGTYFAYSQLGPALLAYVVQRAVGTDLQAYAQHRLFTPIGITKGSYFWLRDRSGMSYGYSNLFLTPLQLARLGLLMQNDGRWRGKQVVPASYVAKVGRPTATNGCYGLLFWSNGGRPCTGANIPAAQTLDRRAVPSAPPDMYQMNGTGGQLNVMIPSLDMTVTTTGYFGDLYPDPSILLGATPGDMQYTFFRTLMQAVEDVHVADPGPYRGDPLDFDINPKNYLDPSVLFRDLFPSKSCNVLFCTGTSPTAGLIENVQALPGLL